MTEGVDNKRGVEFDLTRRSTQSEILRWVRSGLVWFVHIACPCTIWSVARRGIRNFVKARAKEEVGIGLALFAVELIREATRAGVGWSLENPKSSKLWSFPPVSALGSLPGTCVIDCDFCRFGSAHKKPTRLLTNRHALVGLSKLCLRNHSHVELSGRVRTQIHPGSFKSILRTELASEYPLVFCDEFAECLLSCAPDSAFGSDS